MSKPNFPNPNVNPKDGKMKNVRCKFAKRIDIEFMELEILSNFKFSKFFKF